MILEWNQSTRGDVTQPLITFNATVKACKLDQDVTHL